MKILSALYIHVFFIGIIFLMFFIYGYGIRGINLQVFYYLLCSIVLLAGISFFTSAVSVFYKDMGQLIEVLLQIGFWLTPIFWNYNILSENLLSVMRLNPMFYIVDGFRDSFINDIWFWQKIDETLMFWGMTILFFVVGAITFRRLRNHFADVL